ncbi:hypothetical protein TNCV_5037911 [Trichonephila clavipes]|nr:hypothetical protein TNCV_5037911 [Trichonephila clavipes]
MILRQNQIKVRKVKRRPLFFHLYICSDTESSEEKARHGGGFKWITLEKHMRSGIRHVYWLGHMFRRNKWVISLILEDEMKRKVKSVDGGHGSPVVKQSDLGWVVTSSSPVPLKTHRVGEQCTLNLSIAQTSSRWYGAVVRRRGASSGAVHVT